MKKVLIFITVFIILASCSQKQANPLIGSWESKDKALMMFYGDKYKVVKLKFKKYSMFIDEKEIPVIYKIKKNKVILFSKGDKTTAHLVEKDKIIIYLTAKGKRTYIRKK